MKVLVATEKPFAAAAVNGIKAEVEAAGNELALLEKYTEKAQLLDAVKDADYISIHMPLTDETRGMFNEKLFAVMTRKPVIINAARGLIVDAPAMVKALDEGQVSWYCADVYPNDPPAEDYPLLKAQHVTLTPHVGANSKENLLRIGDEIVATIKDLKGDGKI